MLAALDNRTHEGMFPERSFVCLRAEKERHSPNRPIARELHRAAPHGGRRIEVRWARTVTEQFHTKAMSIVHPSGDTYLLLGSANWTRRNLLDFNLEANIGLRNCSDAVERFNAWFDSAWSNEEAVQTLPVEAYKESGVTGRLKTLLYRFQEASGLSSF